MIASAFAHDAHLEMRIASLARQIGSLLSELDCQAAIYVNDACLSRSIGQVASW
jgi:hypothetical protein